MSQSAPTNTAARVIGGDTCHALYKLPFGTLKGRRGCFTSAVLTAYRAKWRRAQGQVIDEFSFLPPGTFHQIDVRSRTATGQREVPLGGLATLLTGDFMQLPHPTLPSLALPVDDVTGTYASQPKSGKGDLDGP